MLAGVGAVDACLFVVAATEGWKPQSEEHLRILELLGVRHGLVALTKVGLVDDERRELARLDVADHVAGTFLEARRGGRRRRARRAWGVDDAAGRARPAAGGDADRRRPATGPACGSTASFAAKGSGTVVTGTLAGGRSRSTTSCVVVPQRRRGYGCGRCRASSERRDRSRPRAPRRGQPERRRPRSSSRAATRWCGRAVATDATVRRARSRVLATLDHEVSRRGAYVAYVGSGEHARAACGCWAPRRDRAGRRRLRPAASAGGAPARCPATATCCGRAGGARRSAAARCSTSAPCCPAAKARPDRSVDRVVAERGWVEADDLERADRRAPPADVAGRWVVHPERAGRRRPSRSGGRRRRPDRSALDVATLDERAPGRARHAGQGRRRGRPGAPGRGRRRPRAARRPPVPGRARAGAVQPSRPEGRSSASSSASWSAAGWSWSGTDAASPPRRSTRPPGSSPTCSVPTPRASPWPRSVTAWERPASSCSPSLPTWTPAG